MIEKTDDIGHTTYWYTATEVAKIVGMKHDNKTLGRNNFIAMLRQNKVLMENNMPYHYYVTLNHIQMHTVQKWHMHYIPIFSQTFIEYCKKKVASGEWKFVTKMPPVVKKFENIDDIM